MEPIAPYADTMILPENTRSTIMAANQTDKYEPLPALRTPDGRVVTQWKPSEEELLAIRAGQPITLIIWTFDHPLQPVWLGVGGVDLT